MLTFLKRPHLSFALVPAIGFVLLVSYFTLNAKRAISHSEQPTGSVPTATSPDWVSSSNSSASISLDSDNDGIPDSGELQSYMDRENFRRWFTLIAEGQFYWLSEDWNAEQRDCSGLVRFAWREALRRHDRLWFQKMGPGYKAIAADVRHYSLEQSPLGEKLFRTNFGSYKDGELADGTFAEFADARTLKSFNTKFVSRDRRNAQPGDVLFYYQPWVQKFPYHVMIFLGDAKLSDEQTTDWVVYHTGSSPTDKGTVKKVELSVLDHHPNRRWRPVESNSNFLGFFRLKIVD
jgi:uncharacterized protein YfaT (DUF1175 family)